MSRYMETCSDWDLLDMVEGLRYPSTLEREMAKRFRRLLEEERKHQFEPTQEEQPKHD